MAIFLHRLANLSRIIIIAYNILRLHIFTSFALPYYRSLIRSLIIHYILRTCKYVTKSQLSTVLTVLIIIYITLFIISVSFSSREEPKGFVAAPESRKKPRLAPRISYFQSRQFPTRTAQCEREDFRPGVPPTCGFLFFCSAYA